MKEKINIRPTSGVYATYKRLSYQPWTAIAEFVDNSTQSYFDHSDELKQLEHFKNLLIEITYESDSENGDFITITDNAFGMERDDFERAIVLDRVPTDTSGRNEFGMGLKTAACWFGKVWTIESTKLGSKNMFTATIDVDKLARDKDEEIDAEISEASLLSHFTVITIKNLNKRITGPRTIGKVRELLSSIYREDIRRGDIQISYNGRLLTFSDPVIFEENLHDGKTKIWKQDVNFDITYENRVLSVKGFVAIRIPGNVREAGFTLIRRGRVIIGGPEHNYRPAELFGESNSYAYQRLFGELHMDNWNVTQAKDNFDWHNDGLEELFISEMQKITKELKLKSESIRVRGTLPTTNEIIDKALESLGKSGEIELTLAHPIQTQIDIIPGAELLEADEDIKKDPIIDITETPEKEITIRFEGDKKFEFSMTYNGKSYKFNIEYIQDKPYSNWIILGENGIDSYSIKLNLIHPFFESINGNNDYGYFVTKFVISLVLAEIESARASYDERIDPSDIRNKMNKILQVVQSIDIGENYG